MNRIYLAMVVIASLAVSCKNDKEVKDTTLPVITIHSPDDGSNFLVGDTIVFSATASDNDELHEVTIHIHNETTDEHIVQEDIHADASTYPYSFSYILTQADSTEFHFEVTATDHSENSVSAEVMCTANF